uniref:Tail completion protein n=1 Tax=Caudovirales sp. ctkvU4 TaxID=2826783 RepID=A0A8S5QQX3_9CAUD|nr:MAG TPA: tail completion protein [Caudovirales sp. ctkvU4]
MTTIMLIKSLVEFLAKSVENYRYEDSQGNSKGVYVKDAFLKRRTTSDEEFLPFIIARPLNGKDTSREGTIKVRLIFGVREEDVDEGWIGLVNLMEHVKQDLLKVVFIDNRYPIEPPLEWTVQEGENYPEWYGYMDVTFTMAHPVPMGKLQEMLGG